MFKLRMVPQENFFVYSTQYVFLIIKLTHGRVHIWNYVKIYIVFYNFVYLFICLLNNIFTMANRIFFFFLKIITIFSSVNMSKFCKQYFFTFILNGIFGNNHSRIFLRIFIHFKYISELPVWVISSEDAAVSLLIS